MAWRSRWRMRRRERTANGTRHRGRASSGRPLRRRRRDAGPRPHRIRASNLRSIAAADATAMTRPAVANDDRRQPAEACVARRARSSCGRRGSSKAMRSTKASATRCGSCCATRSTRASTSCPTASRRAGISSRRSSRGSTASTSSTSKTVRIRNRYDAAVPVVVGAVARRHPIYVDDAAFLRVADGRRGQVHAARPDDDGRHALRRALRQPREAGAGRSPKS